MTKATRKLVQTPGSLPLTAVHLKDLNRIGLIYTMGEVVILDGTTYAAVEPKNVTIAGEYVQPQCAFAFGNQIFIGCNMGKVCVVTLN